ncbi:MAG: SpoIVB peptidase [Oscillospiraceae bacterium]
MTRVMKTVLTVVLIMSVLACGFFYFRKNYLPDIICVREKENFSFGQGLLTVKADGKKLAAASTSAGTSRNGTLYLFDMIPLKTVRIQTVDDKRLIPCGICFGIKMFTAGVVVVGTSDIYTLGGSVNPAAQAGIEAGDIILTIDGAFVSSNEDIMAIVSSSEGRTLSIQYVRDGASKSTKLTPANAKNGNGFKAGMWVRDSSAGIGTVTYYNESSEIIAGLGHGVTDSDTGLVLPVSSGELVRVSITGVEKGKTGSPGELKGIFDSSKPFANLLFNSECGIFAKRTDDSFGLGASMPVALKQEIRMGSCKVLCAANGDEPAYYDAQIESINLSDENPSKNMIVRITDEKLIKITGGIVQGMSGSPIVQNGKIIGALTHVFVNEPTKGYGIFIENMLYNEQYALLRKNNADAA